MDYSSRPRLHHRCHVNGENKCSMHGGGAICGRAGGRAGALCAPGAQTTTRGITKFWRELRVHDIQTVFRFFHVLHLSFY